MARFVSPFAHRPLAAWIEDLQQSTVADDRYRALLAVNALGTDRDAVTWCGHSLKDTDSSVRALAAKQLGGRKRNSEPSATAATENLWPEIGTALAARLQDDDPDVRFEAACALGAVSPQINEARNVLLTLLDDEGTLPLSLAAVVSAVGERQDIAFGELAPRLKVLITHPQAEVRENVTGVIAKGGVDAGQLAAELIVALDDEEPVVRENAAVALGHSGQKSAEVLAALQIASRDEDEGVAAAANTAIDELSK